MSSTLTAALPATVTVEVRYGIRFPSGDILTVPDGVLDSPLIHPLAWARHVAKCEDGEVVTCTVTVATTDWQAVSE